MKQTGMVGVWDTLVVHQQMVATVVEEEISSVVDCRTVQLQDNFAVDFPR